MSRLKIGVAGAGAWGRNHVRTLATMADIDLSAVCDASQTIRDKTARQYPETFLTADFGALLERVDAVVVATPAKTHAELALQAIAAGKPVLVEKPFALTVRDAERVYDASQKGGVPALVGHLLEFHPVIERLREMVMSGALGDVYYLYAQRVNLGQIRPDENALWSFGPHDVSVALYLMGEAPVTVTAQGHSYLQPGIEDVVFLTMTFRSGVVAHAHLSWLDPHKERRLTVVADGGLRRHGEPGEAADLRQGRRSSAGVRIVRRKHGDQGRGHSDPEAVQRRAVRSRARPFCAGRPGWVADAG